MIYFTFYFYFIHALISISIWWMMYLCMHIQSYLFYRCVWLMMLSFSFLSHVKYFRIFDLKLYDQISFCFNSLRRRFLLHVSLVRDSTIIKKTGWLKFLLFETGSGGKYTDEIDKFYVLAAGILHLEMFCSSVCI